MLRYDMKSARLKSKMCCFPRSRTPTSRYKLYILGIMRDNPDLSYKFIKQILSAKKSIFAFGTSPHGLNKLSSE